MTDTLKQHLGDLLELAEIDGTWCYSVSYDEGGPAALPEDLFAWMDQHFLSKDAVLAAIGENQQVTFPSGNEGETNRILRNELRTEIKGKLGL